MSDNKLYDLLNASYKRNKEAEAIGDRQHLKLDHQLSNSEHKVFVDPNTNNTNVVFTGTRKFGDYFTDGALLFGLQNKTQRFKDSDKLIKDVRNKYKDTKITASGDSLGGRIAEHVKADRKVTYNKGVGLGDIGKTIRKNQTDIRAKTDPISVLSNTQKYKGLKIDVTSHYVNPHKYKNLMFLDKNKLSNNII